MPAAEDFGLVVGINDYKNQPFESLKGPKGDADDFVTWLKSPAGGDLLPTNVDPFIHLSDEEGKEPMLSHLWILLNKLIESAPSRRARIGRRLYVFLAGHGISPSEQLDETGLITVEAKGKLAPYLPGKLCADGFCNGGHFDEVLLFMDCCRVSTMLVGPIGKIPIFEKPDVAAAGAASRFYAFATAFGKVARETPVDGKVRGNFSRALIEGLNGRAADGAGRLTTNSLKLWLEHKMSIKIEGEAQKPQFPALIDFVIREGLTPNRTAVNLTLPQPIDRLEVLDGGNAFVEVIPQDQIATPQGLRFFLPSFRSYLIQGFQADNRRVGKAVSVSALWEDVNATL